MFVLENLRISVLLYFSPATAPVEQATASNSREIEFLSAFKSRAALNKKIFAVEKIPKSILAVEDSVSSDRFLLESEAGEVFRLFEHVLDQSLDFSLPKKIPKREKYDELKMTFFELQSLNAHAFLMVG